MPPMKVIRIITTAFCVLAVALTAGAQWRFLPESDTIPESSVTISLLTCAPGADVYELNGHSGLRMQFDGIDAVANWGLFDFDSPNFIYRFVKGETDYCVGIASTDSFLDYYRRNNRRVTEQILNLTPAQAAKVVELVETNLRPENRVYRYNYVKDNCATRPLGIIEKATGAEITFNTTASQLGQSPTFRSEMRYYHRNYPWYQFGIDLALGSGIDYPISPRETVFSPVVLKQLVAAATVTGSDGKQKPLVSRTEILVDGPADGPVLPPTPPYATPMAAMLALLLVAAIITLLDQHRHRLSRWFDALLFGVFGLEGCIIAFLVFVSVHEATSPNWLLLWLNPLCLIVPITVWIRPLAGYLKIYHICNIVAILALAFAGCIGLQTLNMAFLPAMGAGILRSYNFICLSSEKTKQP